MMLAFTLMLPVAALADAASDAVYKASLPMFADPAGAPTSTQGPFMDVPPGAKLRAVCYSGAHDITVNGLLFTPYGAAPDRPAPLIIMLHGLGGRKEQMESMGQKAAAIGYAAFMIDLAGQGARAGAAGAFPSYQTEDAFANAFVSNVATSIIDLRRAIDFLSTVPEVDARHVCVVGGSFGAVVGAIFAGVEPRINAVVLISGGGDVASLLVEQANAGVSLGGHYASLIKSTALDKMKSQFAPVDPDIYAPHIAPRPLFMQNGRLDNTIPPAHAEALYAAAGDPKQIVWLPDSGHNPPPDVTLANLTQFLARAFPAHPATTTASAR